MLFFSFTNNLLCYDRDFEGRDKLLFFVSKHHQGLLVQFDHLFFSLICMKRCHDFEAQYKRICHLCKCLKFGHPKLGDVLKVKRIYNCFLQKLTTTDSTFLRLFEGFAGAGCSFASNIKYIAHHLDRYQIGVSFFKFNLCLPECLYII